MIVLGAWHAFPILALCVSFGILIGVIYVWRAMQKAFFSDSRSETPPDRSCPRITIPEKLAAALLIASSIAVGLYPQMVLNIIQPALNSPLFAGLHQGGW
jgi:NADH-quinone oxidoreductase subunit M